MQKFRYLVNSLINIFQKKICPFCGETAFKIVDRKYLVTSLIKCKHCGLMHRHPRESEKILHKFYQKDYKVEVEMMTVLPSDKELEILKQNNFDNLRDYLPFVRSLFKKSSVKLVDYGCSWGYDVYKLCRQGIDAVGFEISLPRASFGKKKLDIQIYIDENDIRKGNDIVFSSHVIEHLYSIPDFISLSKQKLNRDGIFITFCPNGGAEYRRRKPGSFHVTWGNLHPNYLDIDFARFMFKNNPYILLTSDWPYDLEKIKKWDGYSQVVDDYQAGYELLIIAKPNIDIRR